MTTDTLNFPVFHSDQGIGSDTVEFVRESKIADVTKAKDIVLKQGGAMTFEVLHVVLKRLVLQAVHIPSI